MNFLYSPDKPPVSVHAVRRADWHAHAPENNDLEPVFADESPLAPGRAADIELSLRNKSGQPPTGSLLILLPDKKLKERTTAEVVRSDGAEAQWTFPVLEVALPATTITLRDYPVPEQPEKFYLAAWYRRSDGRIFRLREIVRRVVGLPPESLQVRLSSNVANGVLRCAVAAEQPEAQHFMPSEECNDVFTLSDGNGFTFGGRLRGGVWHGSVPLPAHEGGFTLKAFSCGKTAESNWIDPDFYELPGVTLAWGDLHVHSRESDGLGAPEDLIHRARDWQNLDFLALNEHIENSLAFRPWNRAKFSKLQALYDAVTQDGEFVMIGGFEYESFCNLWCFSHRYLDFLDPWINYDEACPIPVPGDPDFPEFERKIWGEMARRAADPEWLVGYHRLEVFHETPEHLPPPVRLLQVAHYKRPPEVGAADFLNRGDRSGFFGSTDTHIGLPGMPHHGGRDGQSGLTAVLTGDLSRAGLHEALRARRCYATQGNRTLADFRMNGALMGSECRVPRGEKLTFTVRAAGMEPIARMELVDRHGELAGHECGGRRADRWSWETVSDGANWYFPRITLDDGRKVWCSPVWVDLA